MFIYPASGTGAWEAALVNTLSPGDRVLMFETGHFSTLWKNLAEKLGLRAEFIEGDWRGGADPERIEARLAEDRAHEIKAVCVVHNETSTGSVSPVAAVRKAIDAAGHPALFMVDTISGLASLEYQHDAWGVDVTVSGSQKGLMLPPGLSFNAVSAKALDANRTATLQRSYWDWAEMLGPNRTGYFPYTPATNLLYGLNEAIDMLHEEGLDNVFARHARHGAAARAAVRHWGLEVLCTTQGQESGVLTAVKMPEGHSADAFRAKHSGAFRHFPWQRSVQGRGQGVPNRPPGRFQRPDAGRHIGRCRNGAEKGGCSPRGGWGAGRDADARLTGGRRRIGGRKKT